MARITFDSGTYLLQQVRSNLQCGTQQPNVNFQLLVQLVPITTNVVSSIPVHSKMYSIQHYVINFVSDLREVGDFLRVLRFPRPITLTATI